jgi:hypothetical protein
MTAETDLIWFKDNLEKIKGKFIAILNKEIIASSGNYNDLSKIISELKNSHKLVGVPLCVRASKKDFATIKIPSF